MKSQEKIRLRLTLHYDGSEFSGWQVQPGARTVQGELEAAVERLTQRHRAVVGSGRTDTGVHATGQVASVDVPAERWEPVEFRRAMNAVLPPDIWLEGVVVADPRFHPRYDAMARTYEYRIGLADEAWSPFHRRRCWPLDDPVDRDLMEAAAGGLPGEHSFRAFAKAGQPERGEICKVRSACWSGWDELGMVFTVTANRFLRHTVRYLVGTMVEIGWGRRPLEDLSILLNEPDTDLVTSPPAPPEGLCLVLVEYPGV